MIQKVIHYCWFGKKEKGKLIDGYISEWKRIFPDYQIIEWNEGNFDINYNEYVRQAYKNKKYAFVSDVARLYALYTFGGFYFDTDIEVLKPLNHYFDNDLIVAFESKKIIMTGFMAAPANNSTIKEFLELYDRLLFFNEDGSLNLTANSVYLTNILLNKGLALNAEEQLLKDGTRVFPREVFGAFDADSSSFKITEKTILVHRCMASWGSAKFKFTLSIKKKISEIFGEKGYKRLKSLLFERSKSENKN